MRRPVAPGGTVVVKVGSSSLTGPTGGIDEASIAGVVSHVVALVAEGYKPLLVTSGAIAAGLPALGRTVRPTDIADLQVAAAVGQSRLMERYAAGFGASGLTVGQVLLTKDVLGNRQQYLNARSALTRMVELGVIPIVNENDTVVVDEVRVGDNDQLAAITSHLVRADMLIILTDTPGLYADDPRLMEDAQLLSAVKHTDEVLDRIRSSAAKGSLGSGGVATKVAAARMAAFSGIPTVVAQSRVPDVVALAVEGADVGTWVDPRPESLPARKLWIAFGLPSCGVLTVDDGAVLALGKGGRSLLGVGVTDVEGSFERSDAVEVKDDHGALVAKGVVRVGSEELRSGIGQHSSQIGGEVIHRDDLVVFGSPNPAGSG
ncbi:MAG TPA: glutamate 5-kinase [Acidimicrobiia bacterium]|nr:glutamate 5-kinase [Acidimicrobiia bacterium]